MFSLHLSNLFSAIKYSTHFLLALHNSSVMEGLARALGIASSSELYKYAINLHHQFRLRAGTSKFSDLVCLSACLKLSADQYCIRLDVGMLAKKAGVVPKILEACIEWVVNSIGIDTELITIERVCNSLGMEMIIGVMTEMYEELQRTLLMAMETKRLQFRKSPVLIASLAYLTLQTIGIRYSVASICSIAYANHQQVLRCTSELKNLLVEYVRKLSNDEELIKRLKQQSKQPKEGVKKLPAHAVSKLEVSPTCVTMVTEQSFFDLHYEHDLGYSVMLPKPHHPKLLDQSAVVRQFIQTRLS